MGLIWIFGRLLCEAHIMTSLNTDHREEVKGRPLNSTTNILIQDVVLSIWMSVKLPTANGTEMAVLVELYCTLFTRKLGTFIADETLGIAAVKIVHVSDQSH